MQLTSHFSYEEFIHSNDAERNNISNDPSILGPELHKTIIDNMTRTANIGEEIRSLLKSVPVNVSSGYRCLGLNRYLKSDDTSAHVKGLAMDIYAPQYGTPYEVAIAISKATLLMSKIDQLIYEYSWVHVGLSMNKPRNQLWTLMGNKRYASGIIKK